MLPPNRRNGWLSGSFALGPLLALFLLSPAAKASPLFADFEDGLGGWTISGTVRRENTPVLGGDYALFGADVGIGPAQIFIELDLTNISSLTLDQVWQSPLRTDVNLVTVLVYWTDPDGNVHFGRDRDGTSLIATADDPYPNPDTRSFDLSGFVGPSTVLIQWNELVCTQPHCFGTQFAGWIDNVRFHPVPEPSTATLFGAALAVLSLRRRRGVALRGRPE